MKHYDYKIEFLEAYDGQQCEQLVGKLSSGPCIRLNEYQLMGSLFRAMNSRALDLLRIVLGMYAVDRVSPRDCRQGSGGARQVHLEIDVSDPVFWENPEVSALLHTLIVC